MELIHLERDDEGLVQISELSQLEDTFKMPEGITPKKESWNR